MTPVFVSKFMSASMDAAIELLVSSTKLQRDKGAVEIDKFLQNATDDEWKTLETKLLKIFSTDHEEWEVKHGALMGSKTVLGQEKQKSSDSFTDQVRENALSLLEDKESRVRLAAGIPLYNLIIYFKTFLSFLLIN